MYPEYGPIYIANDSLCSFNAIPSSQVLYNRAEHIVVTHVMIRAYAIVSIWESYVGFIVGIKIAKYLVSYVEKYWIHNRVRIEEGSNKPCINCNIRM